MQYAGKKRACVYVNGIVQRLMLSMHSDRYRMSTQKPSWIEDSMLGGRNWRI